MKYEKVIGLEVHVELLTQTKVFCSCKSEFGGEPNTRICEICTGFPGTLPSLNKKVVDFAVRTGLALNCEITRLTRFDRKNYFYPDLPKAYQISQLYLPVGRNGYLEITADNVSKKIGIHELHIEEDAGKLIHTDGMTLIDYNRCGVPLLEIVTEPDFRSADEVIAFLTALRRTLTFLGVSDCKMQEGSMRADVNLSLRESGETRLGTRTEMKNLNSLHDISDAIESESRRQSALLDSGGKVVRQTRGWDADRKQSFALRSKEQANDYRYFPEPDIPPLVITDAQLELCRSELPELPSARKQRYSADLGLSEYDADLLTDNVYISDFFEAVLSNGVSPKEAANWILGELLRLLKNSRTDAKDNPLEAQALSQVIKAVNSGRITRSTGKLVLEKAFGEGIDVSEYINGNSLVLIDDPSQITAAARKVIEENPKAVSDYGNGKHSAFGYLIGQVMKETGGRAAVEEVKKALGTLLEP